jgi:hypothetical protein
MLQQMTWMQVILAMSRIQVMISAAEGWSDKEIHQNMP